MFENLTEKLERSFKILKGEGRITEINVAETLKEIRRALIDADVNYKVAKDFTNTVTERAIGAKVMESLTPAQMVIKIVNEELTALMGGTQSRIASAPHPPTVVMMCGLQGSGKTTHCAKIARKLKSENHRPLLVACDIYRPAAIKQLQVVGEQIGVPVFEMGTENPVNIATEAIKLAKDQGYDYVFLDTAGRLHIDEELMQELKNVKSAVKPHEILLVIDSMLGQDAVTVASSFNEALGIDGLVLTKLDGDTRGGAALSARAVTGKPIKFVGVGEKLQDLDVFHPERMASRILGMGDMLSLIEKVENEIDQKKAEETAQRLAQNKFDMNDLLDQFHQIKKMGPLKSILSMMPGMEKQIRDVDIDDRQLLRIEAVITSMTKKERAKPDIINASRKRRLAAGAGVKVEDVNRLIKQYEQMKKMFKQMGGMKCKGKRSMRGMQLPPNFKF